jgi:hypothetical protein
VIAIPAPFHQIAEMPGPTDCPLLVAEFPAPAVSALSPDATISVPGVDARRIVFGLGRRRDARVAHVAACWRFRNYETFECLSALVEFRGHLIAWHTPYGVGKENRAEIRGAARDALSVALIGDTWPVILRHLDPNRVIANRRTDDEDVYDDVEPIKDTKVAGAIPRLREALWAVHALYHLGRPTSLFSVGPWPKDAWRLPERG